MFCQLFLLVCKMDREPKDDEAHSDRKKLFVAVSEFIG
jgi:hypothetical protein